MIKAFVVKPTKKGLWLIIDRTGAHSEEDIDEEMMRTFDMADGQAYAILEDEVAHIRNACNRWLNKHPKNHKSAGKDWVDEVIEDLMFSPNFDYAARTIREHLAEANGE